MITFPIGKLIREIYTNKTQNAEHIQNKSHIRVVNQTGLYGQSSSPKRGAYY